MSRRVVEFVLESKTEISGRDRAYLIVNKALSFKYSQPLSAEERLQKVEETLAEMDWSVLSPTLKLALACVRGDHSKLLDLAAAAAEHEVSYFDANTWVVFREARNVPGFLEAFKWDDWSH
jgi:hypothetical protein